MIRRIKPVQKSGRWSTTMHGVALAIDVLGATELGEAERMVLRYVAKLEADNRTLTVCVCGQRLGAPQCGVCDNDE
jgi:hypothetical protein